MGFISRPRRFSKSLLVSTLESLFKFGTKDFKGLAIEKLWQDPKTYKVVHLDFSSVIRFDSKESFDIVFKANIFDSFEMAGIELKGTDSPLLSSTIKKTLNEQDDSSVVILIDEYDVPLNQNLDNPELFNYIQKSFADVFSIFKESTYLSKLRSVFITGITRYRNTGIFSGFNNVNDLTLNSIYGDLLGYTDDEIEHYFSFYLQAIEAKLSLSHASLMEKLKDNYDGFCFDERVKKTCIHSMVCA